VTMFKTQPLEFDYWVEADAVSDPACVASSSHAATMDRGETSTSGFLLKIMPKMYHGCVQVSGEIPKELVGTYLRNGPGLQVTQKEKQGVQSRKRTFGG